MGWGLIHSHALSLSTGVAGVFVQIPVSPAVAGIEEQGPHTAYQMNGAEDPLLALISNQIRMIEMMHGLRIQNPEETEAYIRSHSRDERDANRFTAALNAWVAQFGVQPDLVISRRVLELVTTRHDQ